MNWIIAAASAAVLFTVVAVISKELMDHIDAIEFTAIYSLIALIFYAPVFIYYLTQQTPELTTILILAILSSGLGNILGMLSYNYGLKHTSLSIAMPLNRTQPVFVAIIAATLLNEVMTLEKVAGILTITVASYIILMKNPHDPLDPITNLLHDYGAQLATLSAAFFSATSVIDRYVTTNFSPEIYTFLILAIMTTALNLYLFQANRHEDYSKHLKKELTNYKKHYALAGILTAAAYLALYQAFSQAEASKVVPVLQLQVPLTVIAGIEIFDETHFLQKIIGAILLIIGIILVV